MAAGITSIQDVDDVAFEDRSVGRCGGIRTGREHAAVLGHHLRREVVVRDHMDEFPVVPIRHAELGGAELRGRHQDGREDALQIGRRLADEAEDLTRCLLLRERLVEFAGLGCSCSCKGGLPRCSLRESCARLARDRLLAPFRHVAPRAAAQPQDHSPGIARNVL